MNRFEPGTNNAIATELLAQGISSIDPLVIAALFDQLQRMNQVDITKPSSFLDQVGLTAHLLALKRVIGINQAMAELSRDPSQPDAGDDVDTQGTEPTDAEA